MSKISDIGDFAFETLHDLKLLNLHTNELTSLSKSTFYGLENLILLNILKNNILHVDRRLFTG